MYGVHGEMEQTITALDAEVGDNTTAKTLVAALRSQLNRCWQETGATLGGFGGCFGPIQVD